MIASKEKIAEVKISYRQTVEEILTKEQRLGLYKVLGAIEILVSSKIYQKLPTSPAERMVFAFTWLAREVQNGGFDQFFFNSAGDFWVDVSDGLVLVGDKEGESLFRLALSIFPNSFPSKNQHERQIEMEQLEEEDDVKFSSHFDSVTHQFYEKPFPKWELVLNYVKAHPHEFDLQHA